MNKEHFMGLDTEQMVNAFSNDELSMLTFGNTKEANAYRELLAYRMLNLPVQACEDNIAA
ncbi:hypothetical protein [Klebsiella aerogenes]|uniref:hypothetical protein n=1 Tax=Klebsiella aerogenes TaxID=548 RepID=UPI001F29C078|nr:hypothetical protein [Klebsiella aerogenes]